MMATHSTSRYRGEAEALYAWLSVALRRITQTAQTGPTGPEPGPSGPSPGQPLLYWQSTTYWGGRADALDREPRVAEKWQDEWRDFYENEYRHWTPRNKIRIPALIILVPFVMVCLVIGFVRSI